MSGAELISLLLVPLLAGMADSPQSFDTQILPLLTRSGCNAGACHGAAAGRGGFHLSLLGSNPAADFDAITQDFEGRRISHVRPEKSLILTKPSGELQHGGDVVFEEGNPGAKRILEWIRSGAVRGPSRRLTRLEVSPASQTVMQLPTNIPLQVTAWFDNGPPENVTSLTAFTVSDPASVQISQQAAISVLRRGQHTVLARFLDRVLPVRLNVPLSDTEVTYEGEPQENFIDEEILRVLALMRVPVSPLADDATWLRRVSLDLTGRLPEPETVLRFVRSESSQKRAQIVDGLLAEEAFSDYWTLRFSKLLRLHSLPNDREGARTYAQWLRSEIHRGAPLDQMARQLLTATGDSHSVGPANFTRMSSDARQHAELVAQFFMGARLACANCHNHPLDRWTQDDYHGLAAVFAKLERGREVRAGTRGSVTNLRTGQPAVPRVPGAYDLPIDGDHRETLAMWMTSSENPWFARAMVNRLWHAMFGRGLVEPIDDLRDTNPATHPELLDRLTADFVNHDFNIRHTLRLIALSRTYGRSDAVLPDNANDDRFCSHARRRTLDPEVLLDAISDVAGVPADFPNHPPGTRAVTLTDPLEPVTSLEILGRCAKVSGCSHDSSGQQGLSAHLHFMNGDLINSRITESRGRLQQRLADGSSDDSIIQEFWLRALGRMPEPDQVNAWLHRIRDEDPVERTRKLEDFVWSLLNSRQFMENH